MRIHNRSSFTLIELLVVIGIVAILAGVVVLVVNPAELLRQARDSNRLTGLITIHKGVSLFQVDVADGFLGSASTTYFSLIDPSATTTSGTHCQGVPLIPPSGWTYRCAASSTQRRVDGTGWIPVDFTRISSGASFSALPVDPVNTSSSGLYYAYTAGGSWAVTALLESQRYLKQSALFDGGYNPGRFEMGDNLSLVAKSEGLVGWWRLDESSGTLADSSGNGNTGTQSGGVTYGVSGKIGTALSFDGVNDYVQTPTQSISSAITATAWAYSSNFNQNGFIIGKNPVNSQWELFFEGSFLRWRGGSAENITYCSIPANNQWHFIAATQSGTNAALYIDGSSCANTTNNTAISNGNGTIDIGRFNSGYYYNGIIDNVSLYSRVLSAAEIKAIYDATK